MNSRIKEVREVLNLSQQEFADRLNMKRNSISRMETGNRNPSERTINDICREFKVDHLWLTTGIGDMFLDIPDTLLEQIVIQYELDQEEKEIVKNFLMLTKEQRRVLIDLFKAKNN